MVIGRQNKMFSQGTIQCITLVLCCVLVPVVTQREPTVEVGNDYPIDKEGQEWLNSLFYIPSEPRVRREYRMLSEQERFELTDAFVKMKHDTSIKPNKYDLFVSLHARRSTRNSAHRGTGFLGWHRVYTLLMENAMREWYPNITMAYWDMSLDAVLDLPRESSLWSEDYMGNGDGYVRTGPFAMWGTQRGSLYRTVGKRYRPLDDRNITRLFKFKHIGNISYPMNGKNIEDIFEEVHNRVHHFVGGEMVAIETAADDPVFFPYHSLISYVWQEFRAVQRENGIDPETDWDLYYGQARHHKYSAMGLGNLMAIDGSSEIFAENIVFDERPYCSVDVPDCKTPFLYCNVTVEKCCPWTIRENFIIKEVAAEQNITFREAVLPFILNNVQKGFHQMSAESTYVPDKDLFDVYEALHTTTPAPTTPRPTPNTFIGIIDSFLEKDDHKDSEEDSKKERESHESDHDHHHHHHDNPSQGNVVQHIHHDHIIYSSNNFWSNYLTLIVLGCLVTTRIVLGIISKCRRESACCCKVSETYKMDGIVNVNFVEEEAQKKLNGNSHVSRPDNVYTLTVTPKEESQLEQNGSYVTFVKYENNEASKTEIPVPTISDEKQKTADKGNSGNYLDMNYTNMLSHASEQKQTEGNEPEPTPSDMFENESVADDDVDEHYNSIENENFDYIRQAIREAEGGRSEDSFDVFDTYDNLEFKREANRDLGIQPDCDEDFYVNYFPGTHM